MTDDASANAPLCPICRSAALSESWNDKSQDPPCPHCRVCVRGLFLAMGFPLAIVAALLGFGLWHEFIGRMEGASWMNLPDWLLAVPPITHLCYAVWLIWYAAGVRLRLAFVMAAQIGITAYLMWLFPLAAAVLAGAFY